ncbi:Ca2+-binding protein, EF-hand superfamily [Nonomuraea solani]|uniref:Ca2+-binding protein, EF-hand superfamily n=1 Tax=Nonomuraea solani TaxID=1144553 RepID=A0A1H5ZLG4_9ACTN|nr:hypothetical protein [Nonomuraea solani]SEG36970.1 Ca2+-binding protein, EF-hand superfamily [Nonomuraea solani]
MSLSDLQTRKLSHYFALLDEDESGYLELQDFVRSGNRCAEAFGYDPGSAEAEKIRVEWTKFWEAGIASADLGGDGKISKEELFTVIGALAQRPETYDTAFRPSVDAYIDIIDGNGDDQVTQEEYVRLLTAICELDQPRAAEAFDKLDVGRKGHLSREELHHAVKEFYFSTDPQAPGNWTFGSF